MARTTLAATFAGTLTNIVDVSRHTVLGVWLPAGWATGDLTVRLGTSVAATTAARNVGGATVTLYAVTGGSLVALSIPATWIGDGLQLESSVDQGALVVTLAARDAIWHLTGDTVLTVPPRITAFAAEGR